MKGKKRITKLIIGLLLMTSIVTVNKKNILADETKVYEIKINSAQNCITIYEKGTNDSKFVPLKTMACSASDNTNEESAIFAIKNKQEWKQNIDNTYEQYASVIGDNLAIASAPYKTNSPDSLSTQNYNKLGEEKTSGDIWVSVMDAKWIYDNCAEGTGVEIYADASSAGPLGKPETMKLPSTSKFINWDPTDPNENNPWKSCSARIEGAKNIEINAGESYDLLKNVKAFDTCGNDISKYVTILGNYNLKTAGNYIITYHIKDGVGSEASANVKLYVKDSTNQKDETITESVNTQGDVIKTKKSDSNSVKLRTIIGITVIITMFAAFLIKCLKKD